MAFNKFKLETVQQNSKDIIMINFTWSVPGILLFRTIIKIINSLAIKMSRLHPDGYSLQKKEEETA